MEAQISEQVLTCRRSKRYFDTDAWKNHTYATASQVWQLAHKHRLAVMGLDPWADENPLPFIFGGGVMPVTIPESGKCEYCGATLERIAVLDHPGGMYDWEILEWSTHPVRCSCDKAVEKWKSVDADEQRRLDAEYWNAMETERKMQMQNALMQSGMKKRFLMRTFDNFKTDTPGRRNAYAAAKLYADTFESKAHKGIGLYIAGSCGTGKTHLAAAIAIQLMANGHSVVFRSAEDMLQDIKSAYSETTQDAAAVLNRLKTCDLLVIDDLGKEQATDWSTAQLYGIINDRYESQRPLIVTTNCNEVDLITAESPRGVGNHRIVAILSRLHEMCRAITMAWQDCRSCR